MADTSLTPLRPAAEAFLDPHSSFQLDVLRLRPPRPVLA